MATTTFTAAQIASCWVNRHDPTTTATKDVFGLPSAHALHMVITGTDANLIMTSSASNPCSVSVDGGAYSTPTLSPTTAGNLPLFSGLSDAAHTVDVLFRAGFTTTNTWLIASGALSVTGASPAVATDPHYGPFVIARGGGACRTTVLPGTNGVLISSAVPTAGGDQVCAQGGSIRMRGRADEIWALTNASKFVGVIKDGVFVSSAQGPSMTVTAQWWRVAGPGLDDGSVHDWEIKGGCNNGPGMYQDGMMLGGSVAALDATPPTARPARMLAIGDSLTAASPPGGADDPLGDATVSWWAKLGYTLGWDTLAFGRPGYKIEQYTVLAPFDLMSAAAGFGAMPDYLAIFLGRNNVTDDAATVQSKYTALLNAVLAIGQFTGKIVCFSVPLINGSAPAVATGISAAISAVNNSRITYVDAKGWTIATGTDGTHYTKTGHTTFAANAYASGAFVTPTGSGGVPRIGQALIG